MSSYSHEQSVIRRKKLYAEVRGIITTQGRLSLNALCSLVSANEGSVAIARNKVLRELDATPHNH
jgi:hypothetical protein